MPFRARRESLPRWPAAESSPRVGRARNQGLLQEFRDWGSRSCLLRFAGRSFQLNIDERIVRVHRPNRLLEQTLGVFIAVGVKQVGARHGCETAQRRESVMDSRWLIAAMHHAIGALGIAGLGAVLFPGGGFH